MEVNNANIINLLKNQEDYLKKIESLLKYQKTTLNVNEVSEVFDIPKSTLYKLTSSNSIPFYKQAKHLYFDRNEIEDWLKSNRIATNKEVNTRSSTFTTLRNIR